MHIYIHTYIHTYSHTFIHTYIHANIHTHMHTYTQIQYMHIYNIDVSNYYQIIKRVGAGIATTAGAGHLAEGVCG